MEMLQVGVIGTGAIGRSHIERLNRHVTGARVVAVSDINRKAAQEIAETYHAKCYAEGEDLIRDPEVQAVIARLSAPAMKPLPWKAQRRLWKQRRQPAGKP